MANQITDRPELISARTTRIRYDNLSATGLWRWENDPELQFPLPIIIAGRKFWRVSALEIWEATRPNRTTAKPPLPHKRRSTAKVG